VSIADNAEIRARLESALGGRVGAVRRLSGGASRVTSTFELERSPGEARTLVLQQMRGTALTRHPGVETEAALLRAADKAGVPVPTVVAAGAPDGLDSGWLVVGHLDGETLPRHILRDEEFATARTQLTGQTARALAAIHSIDPGAASGLPRADPLRHPLEFLDALHVTRPVLELGVRWLARSEPDTGPPVVVHGDFRMGNFLVDASGLRGVLDWELAHRGSAGEDVGWLCARTWRFGGPGRVGGFGELEEFLAAYEAAGGRDLDVDEVRWWEAYAAVKWAVICLLQASTHLSGSTRSVELAAIGRRACESEWDLLELLGVRLPPAPGVAADGAPPGEPIRADPLFGTPTAAELIAAVRGYLEEKVMTSTEGAARFEARVARNVLATVGRELDLGPAARAAHEARLRALQVPDDAALSAAIRKGDHDDELLELGSILAEGVRDQLLVANPSYLGAGLG
jgi:aminoglycoside phosphotransferase (APT) family kinase protein